MASAEPEMRLRFGVSVHREDWEAYGKHAEPENLPNILDLVRGEIDSRIHPPEL